jgi:hypothetical protein
MELLTINAKDFLEIRVCTLAHASFACYRPLRGLLFPDEF